jgi:hypothetical protein
VNFFLSLRQNCKIMENKGKKIYIYVAVLLVLGLLLLFKTCGSNKSQHETVAQNQEPIKVVEEPAVSLPVPIDTAQHIQVAQPRTKPIAEKKKIKIHKPIADTTYKQMLDTVVLLTAIDTNVVALAIADTAVEQKSNTPKISLMAKPVNANMAMKAKVQRFELEFAGTQDKTQITAGDLDKNMAVVLQSSEDSLYLLTQQVSVKIQGLTHKRLSLSAYTLNLARTTFDTTTNLYSHFYELPEQMAWIDFQDAEKAELQLFKAQKLVKKTFFAKRQYQLFTAEDVKNIALDLKGKYTQANDIVIATPFLPLGDVEKSFTGTYYGAKKSLTFSAPIVPKDSLWGFFAVAQKAQFHDVNIIYSPNLDIETPEITAGLLVAHAQASSFQNITVNYESAVNWRTQSATVGALVGNLGFSHQEKSSFKNIVVQAKAPWRVLSMQDAFVGLVVGSSEGSVQFHDIDVTAHALSVQSEQTQAIAAGVLAQMQKPDNQTLPLEIKFTGNLQISFQDAISAALLEETLSEVSFALSAGVVGYSYYCPIVFSPQMNINIKAKNIFASGARSFSAGLVGITTHGVIINKGAAETLRIQIKSDISAGNDDKTAEAFVGGLSAQAGSFAFDYNSGYDKMVVLGSVLNKVHVEITGGLRITQTRTAKIPSKAGGFIAQAALQEMSDCEISIAQGIRVVASGKDYGIAAGFIAKILNDKETNTYLLQSPQHFTPNFSIFASTTHAFVP